MYQTRENINFLNDSHAIPFTSLIEAVDIMEYGSDVSVMFQMLFLTGCRISELDNMDVDHLFQIDEKKFIIYWRTGKKGRIRKECLPYFYIKELNHYRKYNRVHAKRLFGIENNTFRRYFNRYVRPLLSKVWQEKRLYEVQGILQEQYVLQLKGLRKDFQTLLFKKEIEKWKDSNVALEMVSKRMKHSSQKITAFHYIENFDSLDINRFAHLEPAEILRTSGSQKRIMDYLKEE